jgi:hypothetical protein
VYTDTTSLMAAWLVRGTLPRELYRGTSPAALKPLRPTVGALLLLDDDLDLDEGIGWHGRDHTLVLDECAGRHGRDRALLREAGTGRRSRKRAGSAP